MALNTTKQVTYLVPNLHDEESARFWAHIDKVAAEVATWPEWMKGNLSIEIEKNETANTRKK